jgi:hypothetical protein
MEPIKHIDTILEILNEVCIKHNVLARDDETLCIYIPVEYNHYSEVMMVFDKNGKLLYIVEG